jgi:hypothetical protein
MCSRRAPEDDWTVLAELSADSDQRSTGGWLRRLLFVRPHMGIFSRREDSESGSTVGDGCF